MANEFFLPPDSQARMRMRQEQLDKAADKAIPTDQEADDDRAGGSSKEGPSQ